MTALPAVWNHWPRSKEGEEAASWCFDPDFVYVPWRPSILARPVGLWLSNDERGLGWHNWALVDMPEAMGSAFWSFSIDPSGLLILDSPDEMPSRHCEAVDLFGKDEVLVDWVAIKEDYTGIAVPRYQKHGITPAWWSEWDCDAAVVWDLAAV